MNTNLISSANLSKDHNTIQAIKSPFYKGIVLFACFCSLLLFFVNESTGANGMEPLIPLNVILLSICLWPILESGQVKLYHPVTIIGIHTFIFYGIGSFSWYSLLELGIVSIDEEKYVAKGLFYVILCLFTFMIGFKISSQSRIKLKYLFEINEDRIYTLVVYTLILVAFGKIFQIQSGSYFHDVSFETEENKVLSNTSGGTAMVANILFILNRLIFILIYLIGYLVFAEKKEKYRYILYGIIIFEILFNLPSGSKQRVIEPIITFILIRSIYTNIPYKGIAIFVAVYLFVITPFITLYRNDALSFEEFIDQYFSEQFQESGDSDEAIQNQVAARLNYSIVISRIMKYHLEYGKPYVYGETYVNTLIMFIPRFIWPDKPILISGNIFGKEYGFIQENNDKTSVGKYWIGESFMNFGYIGLFVCFFIGYSFGFAYALYEQYKYASSIVTILFLTLLMDFITTDEVLFYIFNIFRNNILYFCLFFLFFKKKKL